MPSSDFVMLFFVLCFFLAFAFIGSLAFVASCPAGLVVWAEATDTFAQNPSAKKLGLEVAGVTMLSVDESKVGSPVCLVSVNTNHGHSLRYMFRFSAEGTASVDMVP